MQDLLTFKTFISPTTLIIFYYIGAVLMPPLIWFFSRWIMKKIDFIEQSYLKSREMAWKSMPINYKILSVFIFVMIFLFMELLWRMMFEFLIAYMQMREALVG